MDKWRGEEEMKRLSGMQKQIVAFIPRPCGRRVMAKLGTRRIPSDRLGAFWTLGGGWRRRRRRRRRRRGGSSSTDAQNNHVKAANTRKSPRQNE